MNNKIIGIICIISSIILGIGGFFVFKDNKNIVAEILFYTAVGIVLVASCIFTIYYLYKQE